jgi:hypothetical protein
VPLSYAQLAAGGSLTWTVVTFIEAPLNISASQFQVEKLRATEAARLGQPFQPEFNGVFDYARRAPGKFGVGRALYAGFLPHILRNAAGGAFHFGAYEYIRRETAKSRGVRVEDVGLLTNLLAGGAGGFLYWSLTYPLDVVKSAIQADRMGEGRKYFGTVDTFRKLWAEGGAARFTRGFSACIARSVPANAVLLTTAFRVKELGNAWLAPQAAPASSPSAAAPAPALATRLNAADSSDS